MSIANKKTYPYLFDWNKTAYRGNEEHNYGITFKEALILHLATNPNMVSISTELNNNINFELNAQLILQQANAIIQEIDKEK